MAPKRKAEPAGPSAPKQARSNEELLVVSIDFGTRGTGYAYAFVDRPEQVVPKQPGGANDDQKALTCVLLDKDGGLLAFGDRARRDYAEAEDGAWGGTGCSLSRAGPKRAPFEPLPSFRHPARDTRLTLCAKPCTLASV
jgi:hypothetical protein